MELDLDICRVRTWRASDLRSLVRHADNRLIWINLRDRFPFPYTEQAGRHWLASVNSSGMPTNFAIEVDGEAAGGIGFIPGTDVERISAEVGYWLGQAYWGRGIVTAALVAVSDFAFSAFDLHRLFALPFAENRASRRVLEKAGYELEAILRTSAIKDGRILDQALYGRLRTDSTS
jgi:[ribosomal protein S5]-alanine N-acetyltransferase